MSDNPSAPRGRESKDQPKQGAGPRSKKATAAETTSDDKKASTGGGNGGKKPNDSGQPGGKQVVANVEARPAGTNDKTGGASSMTSTLAIILALVAVGGGYFLWQELVKTQQQIQSINAVDSGQLDQLKSGFQQSLQTQADKLQSDIKAAVAESSKELQSQVQQATSTSDASSSSLQGKLNSQINEVKSMVSGLQATTSQIRTESARALAETKTELQAQLHEAISKTNATVAAANEEIAGLKGGFGELRDQVTSRLDAVEQTQNETLATIKQAQKELSDAIGRNRDYWTLSEVEHIVNLANRQVNLERDRAKALASLTSASVRLEGIDSADVVSVREAIENDINALREAESVDVEGASITLNRLARNVGKLPTAEPGIRRSSDSQPNEETEAADDGAWESVKDTASAALAGLRNLVVVRRDGEVVAPLLPPDQSFFLQQNLRLKLETANLALLRQDNEIYHASLADAAAWTEQYFDTSANRTQQFLADVQELDTHNIAPDLPDISGSLDAVRSLVR